MKHLFTISLCFLALSLSAQFTGISVETYVVHGGLSIPALEGYTTYRVYAEFTNQTDVLSALYSDVNALGTPALSLNAPCGCHNPVTSSLAMDGNNDSYFWGAFPENEFDTYWTIGMESSDDEGALASSLGFSSGLDICSTNISDGIMYVTGNPTNAFAGADLKVLFAQVTTACDWTFQACIQTSGSSQYCSDIIEVEYTEDDYGCMDSTACNYDAGATVDDGSCDYTCCPGPGCCNDGTIWDEITQKCELNEAMCNWQPDGNADGLIGVEDLLDLLAVYGDTDLDSDGVWDSIDDCLDLEACNYDANPTEPCGFIDALGECGGGCESDTDGDDICDDIDDCIGVVDECGVCNGPGATEMIIESITILYDSLYAEQIDEWWVFEIGADTVFNYVCDPVFADCGDLVSHDGYDYSTVQIGDQCWFAENCRYLPEVSDPSIDSTTEPHYSVYGYEGTDVTAAQATANYATYGVLYNWPAVMTAGICPSGWHIPTDGEFTELTDFLGGASVAGGKMKEAGYDHWNTPNTGATNSSGWTGLPGGFRSGDGNAHYINNHCFFWSSSVQGGSDALVRSLGFNHSNLYGSYSEQSDGMSVRCIRD